MSIAIQTALSGLMAETQRLGASASNLANLRSAGVDPAASAAAGRPAATGGGPPFVPQRALGVARAGGGVETVLVAQNPASLAVYDPTNPSADGSGFVHLPNVSLEQELVSQLLALRGYQANATIIRAQDEMLGVLVDLKS